MNGSKTAGHGAPFYPQSLERGRRSSRAVMLAVAEMYVKGVSNRDAEAVMQEFGIESLPSAPVSRAAKLLDAELEAWRNRHRGEIRYLILDARYEKVREGGWVRDAAVLSAIGMGPDQRRRVLGVSCALSEAERCPAGLRAARKAVLGGAIGQRCPFHLAQNATPHAPSRAIRRRIGTELRQAWNAPNRATATAILCQLVESYPRKAPKLAAWLEASVPEGLAVLSLPDPPSAALAHIQPHRTRYPTRDQDPHPEGAGLS